LWVRGTLTSATPLRKIRRFGGRAEQGRLRPEIFNKLSASVKELSENDIAKYGGLFERYDVQVMEQAEAALLSAIVSSEWTPRRPRIHRVEGACWRLWFIRSEF
jgi:hypothetical protein